MASRAAQSPHEEAGASSPQQKLPGIANLLNAGPPSPGSSQREGAKQPESASSTSSTTRVESGYAKPAPDGTSPMERQQHLPTPPSEDSKRPNMSRDAPSPHVVDPATPGQPASTSSRQAAYDAYARERQSPYQYPQPPTYPPHPYHVAGPPAPYPMHYPAQGMSRLYPHPYDGSTAPPYAYQGPPMAGYGEPHQAYHITPHHHHQPPPQQQPAPSSAPIYAQPPAAQFRGGPAAYATSPQSPTEYANSLAAQQGGYDDADDRPARRRRGNLPKWATDYLKQWFYEHIAHPYPTEQEKQELCKITGLGMTQLSNWFINARRRQTPAMQAQLQSESLARDAVPPPAD